MIIWKKILTENKYQLSWILYDEFNNIKEIGKGGFATVYGMIKFEIYWNLLRLNYFINQIIIAKNLSLR